MRALPLRSTSHLVALAALVLLGAPVRAQDAPPRPPERPSALDRSDTAAPVPMPRPIFPEAEESGAPDVEPEPSAESPAVDARTDDGPAPPRRPVVEEPEALPPDEERAPLEVTPAERTDDEACLADLEKLGVVFERGDPIDGAGDCGAALPVRVTAIGEIALEPAILVRCPMARALARWTEEAVIPAADVLLDAEVATILTAGAYSCRGRNRREGARLSEHAYANAVDVTGVAFADRAPVAVSPRDAEDTPTARFQREIRTKACTFFRTVLGPGSDAYHDDHLHFDQRERTNDYRLCD